jgi:hypothetical protein
MMTVLVSLLTALAIGEAGRQIIFGLVLLAFLALDRAMKGGLRAAILGRLRTPTPIAAASSAPDTSRGG